MSSAFASWSELRRRGHELAVRVESGKVYGVDPAAGLDSFAALLAVAMVPDTTLLWAPPQELGVRLRPVAPALYEALAPDLAARGRPIWAVATSGSSTGTPKLVVGHADTWELIALHYDRVLFQSALPDGPPRSFATCLPLKFSAAFFMTVLPSLFLRRDLIVHPVDDWTPAIRAAREGGALVLGVPALAAAACLGMARPVAAPRMAVLLGGGHLTASRVERIGSRLVGAAVANLYGTAETGALTVDRDPGHNAHVGYPIDGKPVWIEAADEGGVGAVAAAGPDCCHATWLPGHGLMLNADHVASTDYGRFDAEGHLCLEGRVDGAEKLMGVLVYPRSIERHILALPGVVDARVRVVRADNGLEHLTARVVGAITEGEVRDHCVALPEHERPRTIECVAEADVTAYTSHGKL